MSKSRLNLVVLRVADLERAVGFYRALGLEFVKHAHGKGPEHYACEQDGFVFELYLATAAQAVTSSTRIGFVVDHIDSLITALVGMGVTIVSPVKDSEWGKRAVVADWDGHRVELVDSVE